MEIIKAIPSDLVEIMYLLRVCVRDMNEKGMKHWNNVYPEGSLMRKNLYNGLIYLVKDKGVCKAMMTLNPEMPEDYKSMAIAGIAEKTLFVQWFAVHPKWQQKGISKMLMDFAENFARTNGFHSIMLDIYSNHELAQQICQKNDYNQIGTFHSAMQKDPFVCYSKELK
ncbi:MAG: GNAT family N-acetyltransferase [Bacteroidales bacterium]|nr:GNAT family N-acetyltransferase [Bacteroidales bacterium]